MKRQWFITSESANHFYWSAQGRKGIHREGPAEEYQNRGDGEGVGDDREGEDANPGQQQHQRGRRTPAGTTATRSEAGELSITGTVTTSDPQRGKRKDKEFDSTWRGASRGVNGGGKTVTVF